MSGNKAIVLLSGGLDSATVGALARDAGREIHALTLQYGQRHQAELDAAHKIAAWLGAAEHVVQQIDLRVFGNSALTASSIPVPKDRAEAEMESGIPVTYVPARNTVFLSLALAFAEARGAWDIFIGVNAVDYSGYPDCRPEFIAAFERLAQLATKAGVEGEKITIHAPLIRLTKAEIIRRGLAAGLDYGMTISCYDPSPEGLACGRCDSCRLRRKGFAEAGVPDPTRYQPQLKESAP